MATNTEPTISRHVALLVIHLTIFQQVTVRSQNGPVHEIILALKADQDAFLRHFKSVGDLGLAPPKAPHPDAKADKAGELGNDFTCSSADSLHIVQAAVDNAIIMAHQILEHRDAWTPQNISDQLSALFNDLDAAEGNMQRSWENLTKATESSARSVRKCRQDTEALEAFRNEDNQRRHGHAVNRQRRHVRKLSTRLERLHHAHVSQHLDKTEDKQEALNSVAITGAERHQDMLAEATVYSTIKKGHEGWAPMVREAERELLLAGQKYSEMLTKEATLQNNAQHSTNQAEHFGRRLQKAGKALDAARVRCSCAFEAIAAFSNSLAIRTPVTHAKNSIAWAVTLYEEYPERGYVWACQHVIDVVLKADAKGVQDVEGRVKQAVEAMRAEDVDILGGQAGEASELGVEGKGKGKEVERQEEEEAEGKAEGVEDSETKKPKGKGKKKGKGKGKGK
ncbi:MAG: hypothetical protein L6R39_007348 [Caloplaca ligustica]|nr:MAG: hypothetical protein L6R39_007348 [Caloplaca ligustica]